MNEIYEEILNLKKGGGESVLVTVVEKEGSSPSGLQTKMLVFPDGKKIGTVGGGSLEYAAVETAGEVLNKKTGFMKKYSLGAGNELIDAEDTGMICGGTTTLFFEYIGSGEKIYIFGAGHVGRAILYHLNHLDYHITIVDSRDGFLNDITNVQKTVKLDNPENISDIDIADNSFVIIASHSHEVDFQILKGVFKSGSNPRYVGLIGSRKKVAKTLKRLKDEAGNDLNLENLYTPIGLDTGGRSPHDIAISIVSEIQAVRYDKKGNLHMSKIKSE
ncbi:XdhC family protein [Spirochaetota bacterium]